ncbi:MAG: hypothetical protein RIK87_25150 [Fuerstiella sp.]
MTRLRFMLLMLISGTLLLLTAQVPAQAQEKQDTAIGKVADLIGDALRAAVGQRKAVRAEAVVDAPAMVAVEAAEQPPRAASEVEQRLQRLNAWSAAMQSWIGHAGTLSDEQLQQLQQLATAEIKSSQQKWAKPNPRSANEPLLDTFPIKFTVRSGTAEQLDLARRPQKLKSILTEDQLTALQDAEQERRAFQFEAMVGYVLNLLDDELYLTAKQRQDMREPLAGELRGKENTSFSMFAQSYYYPQSSITFLLQEGDHLQFLNDAQKNRASDFSNIGRNGGSNNSEQYIMFESSEGTDGWYRKLKESAETQRARIQRACEVRVAYYQQICRLPDDRANHLRVAGKGVTDQLIRDWKKTTSRQLKNYEQQVGLFNGNFSFSMQVANQSQIDSHDLWKHTLESLSPEVADFVVARETVRRDATARFLTALLDRELWLLPEQRPQVQQLVQQSLPAKNNINPYRNYMDEVAMLIVPLFKFSKQDATVFQGPQQAAWETLKKEFEFNGRYVLVHMKNGGQFHFPVPQ